MFNLHTHTKFSHDGKNTVDQMCQAAIEKGLNGIAFTDHIDLLLYEERDILKNATSLKNAVLEAKQKYDGKLKVLLGIEMGEEYFEPKRAKEIRDIGGYDVILGSLHFLPFLGKEYDIAYVDIPIWSKEKIFNVLKNYLEILAEIANTHDVDVISHITYPLRYINAIYKKGFDDSVLDEYYKKIFLGAIKNGKAIEVNTSNASQNFFMPDERLIKMYRDLGGKLITIGSDAHNVSNVDNGLKAGEELIKKCGFNEYYYFENRKPHIAKKL